MRSRRRSGVSAVVGTAIAVMIFFTVMIPMWLYIQQIQTIFMDEVSRRLQFEVEKLNEKLEVIATLQPPEINPFGKRSLFIIMMNKGPVEISVPTLYVESSRIGLQKIEGTEFKMPPGAVVVKSLNFFVEPNEKVVVRAPTLRGNSFVSGEPIGPNALPYLLVVQLSNVSLGYRYRVEVAVERGESVNMIRGCVSLREEEFAEGCKGSAYATRFISSVEDMSDVFAFNIVPGVYIVRALQCSYDGSSCANISPSPVRVEANGHVVVQIGPLPRLVIPTPIPLQISPLQPNLMVLLGESDIELNATIPFIVSLGNNTEPLRNINVQLEVIAYDNVTLTTTILSTSLNRLSPGDSYIGLFTLRVRDEGDQKWQYGGYIVYQTKVLNAQGLVTGNNYQEEDLLSPEAQGVVYVCKWWYEGANVRTSCRAPTP